VSDFVVVIPARYASTRLPAKALLDIAGKPMVVHVADRARLSGAREVWIATDDERIAEAVSAHGHQALMTDAGHASGTDRIAEVAAKRGWSDTAIVVNVQGDEPRVVPELIREVAQVLQSDEDAVMSTACHSLHRNEDLFDPNVVMRAPEQWPEAGPFVGREATMRQLLQLRQTWHADSVAPITEFIDAGNRVVVRWIWRGEGQGPPASLGNVVHLHDSESADHRIRVRVGSR